MPANLCRPNYDRFNNVTDPVEDEAQEEAVTIVESDVIEDVEGFFEEMAAIEQENLLRTIEHFEGEDWEYDNDVEQGSTAENPITIEESEEEIEEEWKERGSNPENPIVIESESEDECEDWGKEEEEDPIQNEIEILENDRQSWCRVAWEEKMGELREKKRKRDEEKESENKKSKN